MSKKKASKKKVARKKTPVIHPQKSVDQVIVDAMADIPEPGCINCFYSRPNPLTTDTVRCHRYPTIMKSMPDHWCGEYKVK